MSARLSLCRVQSPATAALVVAVGLILTVALIRGLFAVDTVYWAMQGAWKEPAPPAFPSPPK